MANELLDIHDADGRINARLDIKEYLTTHANKNLYDRLSPAMKIMVELLVAAKINKNVIGHNKFKRNGITSLFVSNESTSRAIVSSVFNDEITEQFLAAVSLLTVVLSASLYSLTFILLN